MLHIQRSEIWIAELDPVRGSEQGGTRPCLVIQNDIGNQRSNTVIVAAITGQRKKVLPTHVSLHASGLPCQSIVLLEQLRTLDKSRLRYQAGRLSDRQMEAVERAIDISLGKNFLEELR